MPKSVQEFNKRKGKEDLPLQNAQRLFQVAKSNADAIHDNVDGEINAITEETNPASDDILIIEDASNSYAKKKLQITNLPGGGTDADAIHDNVANEITAITPKTSLVSADEFILEDSGASYVKKAVTFGNFESSLSLANLSGELSLDDLASGSQGSIIRRGATDWEEYTLGTTNYVLKAGASDVAWGQVDWSEITSKPSEYTPSAHAIDIASGYHTGSLPLTDLGSYLAGRIIYGGASDWTYLGPGTENHYLKMDASYPHWEALDISEDGTPQLGGNLDGNDKNITGVGASYSATALILQGGDDANGAQGGVQIRLGYNGTQNYAHSIQTRHHAEGSANNAIDFWLWNYGTDASGTLGTKRIVSMNDTPSVDIYGDLDLNNNSIDLGTGNLIVDSGGDVTLTPTELAELATIDSTTISTSQWTYLGAMSSQPLEALTDDTSPQLSAALDTAGFSINDDTGNNVVDINDGLTVSGSTKAAGGFYTGITDPTDTNRLNYDGYLYATRIYNAIYNDYADYWKKVPFVKRIPGVCYSLTKNGLIITKKRADKATIGLCSDTYGHAVGHIKNGIAISIGGFILAYCDKEYDIGDLLVSNAKGILTLATKEEIIMQKCVAKYMYKEKKIKTHGVYVKGRHWVKVI